MIKIPYSQSFAKKLPSTVEKQLKQDGVFDEDEMKLLNPTEIVYLINDGENQKKVNEIIGLDPNKRRNVCSALWLMHPEIATQSSCPSEKASLHVELATHPSLFSDAKYESRVNLVLGLLRDTAPQAQNVFGEGPWRVVPKDQAIDLVLVPSLEELKNLGVDSSFFHPKLVALTRYHPHPETGEPMITVYLLAAAIREGLFFLSTVLAHELFGHVHIALTGKIKQLTNMEAEKSACQIAIRHTDALRQWVRQHIKSAKDVDGMLKRIGEAERDQKVFMEFVSTPTQK